jgi:hypothetical protein
MAIDFNALTRKLEDKKGRCFIPITSYDWVSGYRVDCITDERTPVKVYYLIEEGAHGYSIKFLNGVTGFESYYVHDLLANEQDHPTGYWAACCETIGRWDGLYVDAKQVDEKLRKLPFDVNTQQ